VESPSRPIGFALAAAERTVKAESCSCTVATKQQLARSGDVESPSPSLRFRPSRHPRLYG